MGGASWRGRALGGRGPGRGQAQPCPALPSPAPWSRPAPTSWLRALDPPSPLPLCAVGPVALQGSGGCSGRVVWTRDSGRAVQTPWEQRDSRLRQSSGRGGSSGSGAVNSGDTLEAASHGPHSPVRTGPAPSFPHKPRPCCHSPGARSSLPSRATGWSAGLARGLQAEGASLSAAPPTGHEHAMQAAAHPGVQEHGAGGLPPAPPGLPRPGALHLGAAPAQGAPAQPEGPGGGCAQPPEVGCPQDLGPSNSVPPGTSLLQLPGSRRPGPAQGRAPPEPWREGPSCPSLLPAGAPSSCVPCPLCVSLDAGTVSCGCPGRCTTPCGRVRVGPAPLGGGAAGSLRDPLRHMASGGPPVS